MAIPGLFIRSFGTGPDALNNAEANALTSMRDRQAFADEQEARRRRAVAEQATYADPLGSPTPFAGVQGALSGVPGAMTSMAFKMGTPAPAAPVAGAAPAPVAGAAPAPVAGAAPVAGVTVPSATKTIAQSMQDPEIQKSIMVTYRHNLSQVETRINNINAELGKLYASGNDIINTPKKEQLKKELAAAEALRLRLRSGLTTAIQKSMTAAPVAGAAPTRVGVPFLLAKPEGAAPDGNVQFAQLAQAVMQAESRGNPNAVSPEGAVGLMQVMPKTSVDPGYGVAPARDNSSAENVRVGTEYLAAMLREFNGNTTHALAAYNWGPGKTKAWIAKGANFADLPKETQDYIPKVFEFLGKTTGSASTAQLGAAAAPASNAVLPPVEQAELSDYSNAVPVVNAEYNQTLALRQAAYQRAVLARDEQVPELYAQSVAELRQLDMKLVHLQGMVGLGDIVDDPMATQRLSQVISHYRGKEPGYYILQPRPDGKYNEIVNGRLSQQGITLQQVIDKTRMMFDASYAASVNAIRAKQAEAAIEIDGQSKLLAQEYGFKLTQALAEKEADALIEMLKSNSAFKQAVAVATINNQGKAPEIKLFNTASGITVGTVGGQMFKIVQEEDRDGNLIAGTEFLKVLPRE